MSSVLDASSVVSNDEEKTAENGGVILEVPRGRMYSSSALHAAKYFCYARADAHVLDLADELGHRPELPVVAIIDVEGKTLGIVVREKLFGLLGKSFGREVLGRSRVSELALEVPVFDAHADLFAVAGSLLADGDEYCILSGPGGAFLGILASQDLANYLSRMTQDDIELAGRLQERLLGASSGGRGEASEHYGIEAWSRPAKGVGGDFYFVKELPGGQLFLALCDVSGKGVAASIIVSMVWGMLTMFDYQRGLSDLVVGINDSIVTTFHMEKYLTGVFLIYDPAGQRLAYADMGHSHATLFRGGRPRLLRGPRGNLPVGVEAELEPDIAHFRLKPGDKLFLYTDGLIEQEDSTGREFGERHLIEAVLTAIEKGESLRDAIPKALDAHRGVTAAAAVPTDGSPTMASDTTVVSATTPQQDDMSFLLLSIK
jgi:sigma-B regulation protein RsbU (phosphoserine phosphatase)